MELNEYQDRAMSTCMPSCNNISYMLLNLWQKSVNFPVSWPRLSERVRWLSVAFDKELQKEAGDILWQFVGVCSVMGWRLENVGVGNLEKLADREQRGVIDGDGDNR